MLVKGTCFVIDDAKPHLGGNMYTPDPATYCPEVWEWLLSRYKPATVLDVGCGTGEAMQWLAARSVAAMGIEGLAVNAAKCVSPVVVHDLGDGPVVFRGIDLVWCCEVVEHVAERHLSNLLDTLCVGKVLAMTHAPPGQGGHHHVNEKPRDYWVRHIEARGYRYNGEATGWAHELVMDRKNYFSISGLIFERE